jgi:hypothetical protein
MFTYPIPLHNLAACKWQVAVVSHSPISLAIATANAILTSLRDSPNPSNTLDPTGSLLGDRDSIILLDTDLQNIIVDVMHVATTMFPLKASTPCKG